MDTIMSMLESHPRSTSVDTGMHGPLLQELSHCETTCTICADACLSEPHVQMLAKCIALNLDCADSCSTTMRTVGRFGFQDSSVVRGQLEACRESCRACAAECELHQEMEHCRTCAEMCRRCEQACTQALEGMMATV